MKADCTALASALSLAYRTYEPFPGPTSSTLNDYLASNGILISVCMSQDILHPREPCSLPFYSNRISASWIQANVTGFRTIFGPEEYELAYILDPLASDVRCMYPADGNTLGRDKSGCGEFGYFPFWTKWSFRRNIIHDKNERFGKDTDWGDISCIDFFLGGDEGKDGSVILHTEDPGSCESMTEGEAGLAYFSDLDWLFQVYRDIMGFPVCDAATIPKPRFSNDSFAFYTGPCSWSPDNWSHMVDSMKKILKDHPELTWWNEIILKKPFFQRKVVKAVVYFGRGQTPDDDDRAEEAKKEAKRFHRPLLKLDMDAVENGGDIFVCLDSDVPDTEVEESIASIA